MPFPLAARQHLGRTTLLLAAIGVLALAAVAPTADAAVSCTFSSGTATVSMTGFDTATVSRNGTSITVNTVACGTATTANTNTIKVLGDVSGQTLQIDLATPFTGGTSEGSAATSEIEFQVVLAGGYDTLTFLGGTAVNSWRLGTTGLNHNADADGDDLVYSGIDQFGAKGFAGNDVIDASGGLGTGSPLTKTIQILGGAGNDTLTGGSDFDQMLGDSDDLFTVPTTGGADTLNGGDSGDQMGGGPGIDTLNGGDDGDTLCGNAGNDKLNGNAGADTFEPAFFGPQCDVTAPDGADVYAGGSGRDRISFAQRAQNIHVSLDNVANDGADTTSPANNTADEGDNVRADIEDVDGGSANDTLNANVTAANAADANNALRGYNGADKLYGGVNDDYLDGGLGIDTLDGGPESDQLYAGDGNDILRGGDGNDYLDGSTGKDNTSGDAGNDTLPQGAAIDTGDTLSGGTGRDSVSYSGRSHNVRIALDNAANDGGDADQNNVAEEADNVKADVEEIRTGSGKDTINANTAAANAAGLDNFLDGGNGIDTILGGAGEDSLYGWDGADVLTGGPGEDYMFGGAGIDRFIALDGYFDRVDGGGSDGVNDTGTFDAFDEKLNFP